MTDADIKPRQLMLGRRDLLELLPALPFGGFLGSTLGSGASNNEVVNEDYRDFFEELGLRTFINAQGTYTYLTGPLMLPTVVGVMQSVSDRYVDLNDLQDAVGERLASMCRSEAAMVTTGAASALTLGTAAVITGTDEEKIRHLPNLPGPQREVIIQRSHRFSYDHTMPNTSIRFVEVETKKELEDAISERTVMMLFLNYANFRGKIQVFLFDLFLLIRK